jgi:hypothetical protein
MHFYIFIKLLLYIVICMDIAQASFRVTHSPAMPHEGRVRRGFSAVPERANREPRTAATAAKGHTLLSWETKLQGPSYIINSTGSNYQRPSTRTKCFPRPFKGSLEKEQRAWSVGAPVRHGHVPHGPGHLSAVWRTDLRENRQQTAGAPLPGPFLAGASKMRRCFFFGRCPLFGRCF